MRRSGPVDATDLDGDGRPEVLVCHNLHPTKVNWNTGARWEQAWLTRLAGRMARSAGIAGSTRSTTRPRITPPSSSSMKSPSLTATAYATSLWPSSCPLTRTPGTSTSVPGAGRTGRPLWSHRLAPSIARVWLDLPVHAPDSSRATSTATARPRSSSASLRPTKAASRRLEFTVLDGATGAKRWDWHRDGATDVVPIHLARLGRDDRRSIVVRLPDGQGKEEILVLDERGRALQRRPSLAGWGLEVRDLDGDGTEEFVFFDGDTLHVTQGGCLAICWTRDRVGTITLQSLGEIRPASKQSPATIIANQRFGLEGTTGRVLWDSTPSGVPA